MSSTRKPVYFEHTDQAHAIYMEIPNDTIEREVLFNSILKFAEVRKATSVWLDRVEDEPEEVKEEESEPER